MHKLVITDRLLALTVAVVVIPVLAFPQLSVADTTGAQPINIETNTPSTSQTIIVNASELIEVEASIEDEQIKLLDEKVQKMKAFLQSKNSPWANDEEAIRTLVSLYHYRLIVGIGHAEANLRHSNARTIKGRVMTCYNYWGIGGGRPECYGSLSEAFVRADGLINKYYTNGLNTPEKMKGRWVGWNHPTWHLAVRQTANKLENLGI